MLFNHLVEIVDKAYLKANLEKFYYGFLKDFLQQHQDLLQQRGYDISVLKKQKLYKVDLVLSYAAVLHEKDIFNLFLQALPNPLPQLWEHVILEEALWSTDIEKKYGLKIVSLKTNYSSQPDVESTFLGLSVTSEYVQHADKNDKYRVQLSLAPELKQHLLSLIQVPDSYKLQPVHGPEDVDFIYEDNNGIFEEMPLFMACYLQGDLRYSNTGKPMASGLNKLRKTSNSREFFPEDKENKALVSLRAQLVAEALPLADKKAQAAEVPVLLKNIIHNFEAGNLSLIYSLLFHLKGTGYAKNGYEDRTLSKELVKILAELETGKWYEYSNLKRYVKLYHKPLLPVSYYTAQYYIYLEIVVPGKYSNYKDRYYPKEAGYPEMISNPLLKSVIFFFAALGIVDIAYDYPNNPAAAQYRLEYLSVWDGLRYVRLTPLGAYVLGKTSSYEAPVKEKSGELYLEEDRLLINYTGDDKITLMMLEKIAAKSTTTRYKVDYQIFLKDCTTRLDIENKIGIFRAHISAKPPQVWENFFQELLDRHNPLLPEDKLRAFRIPIGNTELISLIARDEVLKKLVIKAEQYHILVKDTDLKALRSRLEHFGYLQESGLGLRGY